MAVFLFNDPYVITKLSTSMVLVSAQKLKQSAPRTSLREPASLPAPTILVGAWVVAIYDKIFLTHLFQSMCILADYHIGESVPLITEDRWSLFNKRLIAGNNPDGDPAFHFHTFFDILNRIHLTVFMEQRNQLSFGIWQPNGDRNKGFK
jgi:hypothetical protein